MMGMWAFARKYRTIVWNGEVRNGYWNEVRVRWRKNKGGGSENKFVTVYVQREVTDLTADLP
jgi:hypothetical protein